MRTEAAGSPRDREARDEDVLNFKRRLTKACFGAIAALGAAYASSALQPGLTNPDVDTTRFFIERTAVGGIVLAGLLLLLLARSSRLERTGRKWLPCWVIGTAATLMPAVHVGLGPTGESGFSGCGNAFTGTWALLRGTVPPIDRSICVDQLQTMWWLIGANAAVAVALAIAALLGTHGQRWAATR